ncbi:MAG: hypothetical protein QGI70_04715 [Paracoccaceae bacterium]|jgi:hypothetical protein|nr:hypothetical protein [Paracoccaceae bacterium]
MTDADHPEDNKTVIPMPFSRRYPTSSQKVKDLGLSDLSRQVEPSGRGAKGHWCSRCRGIWYSYFLEAECPKCGNRHG